MDELPNKKKQQRDARRAAGLCATCGSPSEQYRCNVCQGKGRANSARYRTENKENGLCIKCGKHSVQSPHVKCGDCLEKQRSGFAKKVKTNKKKGLCIRCSTVRCGSSRFCETCYYKSRATKHFGNVELWVELKSLFERQCRLCPYTGLILTLGRDAHLDHKCALSSGGENAVNNMQWIHHKANIMKWKWSEGEFLNMVKLIYENTFSACTNQL